MSDNYSLITDTLAVHRPVKDSSVACEDERLCLSTHTQNGDELSFIAVLDGCGGSGGKRYPEFDNWSGAKLAAHEAGRIAGEWFMLNGANGFFGTSPETVAFSLKTSLQNGLKKYAGRLGGSSLIKSNMSKTLPTTLAGIIAEPSGKNSVRIMSLWAGDSRAYMLDPVKGLIQLTRDDVRGGYDPYEDLINDGLLANAISASADFTIHSYEAEVTGPCLLLCASDGCFSYFRSPMEVEHILLETLVDASSSSAWEQALTEILDKVSGDDHTLQLAVVGFRNFNAIRTAYSARFNTLMNEYINPLYAAFDAGDESVHPALWNKYKIDYLAVN